MVNKLIETIGKEAEVFESFLELLEKQQKMLVENNLEGLQEVTEQQHLKLLQSKKLNDERIRLVEEIKKSKNIDGDLTVSKLIEQIDKNQADQLGTLRKTILLLNDKITHTRNQNAMLLNRSREYIMKTMEMLSRINRPKSTYSSKGVDTEEKLNVAIDRRV